MSPASWLNILATSLQNTANDVWVTHVANVYWGLSHAKSCAVPSSSLSTDPHPYPGMTWSTAHTHLTRLPSVTRKHIHIRGHARTHTQNNTRKPLPQRCQLWIYMLHTVTQSQLSLLPRLCFYHVHKNSVRILVKSLVEACIHNICKCCPELPNNLLRNMRSTYPIFFLNSSWL